MAKDTKTKKEKLVSALSLWREFDPSGALDAEALEARVDEATGLSYTALTYNGRTVEDGTVRIFAYFARPAGEKKCPAILLLKEADKPLDVELMAYFVQKGYAVLMPDYSGVGMPECTQFPASLSRAGYAQAQGMYDLEGISANQSCWFEWTYVALYSLEYLKSREDIEKIGVVGIRTGGEVAWKVMLSPDVACGVPINAAGWLSARGTARFAEGAAVNQADERHRYIAAVESQSYAPFVKCPVLMLCALSDYSFDYDRAYDTYCRIGGEREDNNSAIVYSPDSGSCIGIGGLTDMDLFLGKHLKNREIFIPSPLNVVVREKDGKLLIEVVGDEEAIVEEMGVCYAESDVAVRSIYREWQCVYKQCGAEIKDGKIACEITPFAGAPAAFVYAYAKYLNGFKIVTKVVAKRFDGVAEETVGSRMLFTGSDFDCFSVARHEDYSIAGIFLEKEAAPKLVKGYGGISGAYSVGGIKTYKISSPRYVAGEGALLKFDAYTRADDALTIFIEVAEESGEVEQYSCRVPVKGGGKWKRIILEAKDFKSATYGRPLSAFSKGSALSFHSEIEENEYAITNVLWL
jgi:dienelactone hydrolase